MDSLNGNFLHYKFNLGQDNILIDHSGNFAHGQINGPEWMENIEGCTDETACNYNSDANIDDNSCDYSCYDYSLSFNGQGDRVELPANLTDGRGSMTFSAWFNAFENNNEYANIIQHDASYYLRYTTNEDFQMQLKTTTESSSSVNINLPIENSH